MNLVLVPQSLTVKANLNATRKYQIIFTAFIHIQLGEHKCWSKFSCNQVKQIDKQNLNGTV